MAPKESEIVRRLNKAGNQLLQIRKSKTDLLNLLEEAESVLKDVGQGPSQSLQDALIPAMMALVTDSLIKNPAPDVRIMVAACFNEITRITAPDAPYEDNRMKEVFELIVEAFDNLSALSGRSYDKAVSIIVNVASVRSCLLMLDLECEDLIIKMFEQFQKNIRADHPNSVFSAMKTIMSLVIEENESMSLELLKALLNSVSKENEKSSSMSWKLGTEVIEQNAETLGPYLRKAISSGLIDKDYYAPIVGSIYQSRSDDLENKHSGGDSADHPVAAKKPVASATSPIHPVQSGDHDAKSDLGSQSEKRKRDAAGTGKSSKVPKHSKQIKSPRRLDPIAEAEHENETKSIPSKTGKRSTSQDHDIGNGAAPKKSLLSPRGRPKKNFAAPSSKSSEMKSPVSEGGNVRKEPEVISDLEGNNRQPASVQNKKIDKPKNDTITESGNKSAKKSIKKETDVMDESSKKVTRRKREQMDEEIFETPYGRKKYKEDIIGFRVKVYWPLDKAYYEGRIASYNAMKGTHRVEYDDGDVESLNLRKETFEFTADADDDDDDVEVPRKELASPSARQERKKNPATRKQKTPRRAATEEYTAPTSSADKPSNSKDSKPKTSNDAEGESKNNAVSAAKPTNSKDSKPKTSNDAKGEATKTPNAVSSAKPKDSKSRSKSKSSTDSKGKNKNTATITSASAPNNSKDLKSQSSTDGKDVSTTPAISAATPNNDSKTKSSPDAQGKDQEEKN